ncbi:MAG: hypothetical protein HYX60_04485 [Legionella longbeachae]|nr:hypothetical protein [Legionella longbeachae]
MKLSELIENFPWTDHPLIRNFAESFSKEQWQDFTAAGLGDLIVNDKLSDEHLYKLMNNIHEVSNYSEIQQKFQSGELAFKQLVEFQMNEEIKEKILIEDKVPTFHQFKSSINYLLSLKFDKNVLNELFRIMSPEYATARSYATAHILCQSEMTEEEKIKMLENSIDPYPLSALYSKPNASPIKVIDYIANTLNYEQFKFLSNSKVSCFFKPNPSVETFQSLKKETLSLLSFINYCKLFISSQLVNKSGNENTATNHGF